MKLIVHIIFISIVFSQTSSLSMYGLGEYVNSIDASSVALGDSKYFAGYNNRISFSSPSSYWKSSLSNLMMSISTNINDFAGSELIENNFQLFSFTFPIRLFPNSFAYFWRNLSLPQGPCIPDTFLSVSEKYSE